MTARRSPILASCILPLIALLVFGVVYLAFVVVQIPVEAENVFGPPRAGLGGFQRYLLSAMMVWQKKDLLEPVDLQGEVQPFRITLGESTPSVIGRLWQQGLISNPGAFRNFLQYSGLDRGLQAGEYFLSSAMAPLEIARALQDATPAHVTLNILAGWRLEEIAAALPTTGLQVTPDEFLAATRKPIPGYSFSSEMTPDSTLEGFLYPGVYELHREIQAMELVRNLLDGFENGVTSELRKGFIQQGLNLFQAVTLASIVEREAIVKEEMPLVASVFYNRLEIGMKLDTDPTVQYALGFSPVHNTWWKAPLSSSDLQIDSPYNTYRHPGLPPGPIANPGLTALRAVAFPAKTPYYYFRAMCDGSQRHAFAESYQQHLNNACP